MIIFFPKKTNSYEKYFPSFFLQIWNIFIRCGSLFGVCCMKRVRYFETKRFCKKKLSFFFSCKMVKLMDKVMLNCNAHHLSHRKNCTSDHRCCRHCSISSWDWILVWLTVIAFFFYQALRQMQFFFVYISCKTTRNVYILNDLLHIRIGLIGLLVAWLSIHIWFLSA